MSGIVINGVVCTTIEQVESEIAGLSEQQKNFIRNDFNGVSNTQSGSIKNIISSAVAFGMDLMIEFASENVMLGITQAGMTNAVRQRTAQIVNCLMTGSLYDAIVQARAIPAEDKDPTFLTDARLLAFVNKIETYLGIPLSVAL